MDEGGQKIVQPYVQTARFEMEDGSKQAINYPVVLGNDASERQIRRQRFPHGVLISRDGKLVKITSGLVSRDEMVKDIEKPDVIVMASRRRGPVTRPLRLLPQSLS